MTLSIILALACGEKDAPVDTDTGVEADADADSDADSDTDADADTDVEPQGFDITGTSFEIGSQGPGTEGLCIDAVDPSAAFTGGELKILASSSLEADGTFTIEAVETNSVLGLFLLVTDCADVAPTMPTASGVPFAAYDGLGTGDLIAGRNAVVVAQATADGVAQSLVAAGYEGDISEQGFVLGFVRDAEGTPVQGATVSCGEGCAVYYADVDPSDGMFTSAGELNTGTSAQTGGVFVVPNGPLTSYSADHETIDFPAVTFGGMPGLVTVMAFAGQ